jgi:DNA-binding MarR family transcriptional regulator
MADISLRRVLGRSSKKAAPGKPKAARKPPVIAMHSHALYYLAYVSDRSLRTSAKVFSREFGIAITEWRILVQLITLNPARPNDFLEFTGVDKSNVSRALSRLHGLGYIVVSQDPEDPRLNLVEITERGRVVQERTSEIALAHEKVILDGFSKEERKQLLAFLKRLMANSEKLVGETYDQPPPSARNTSI